MANETRKHQGCGAALAAWTAVQNAQPAALPNEVQAALPAFALQAALPAVLADTDPCTDSDSDAETD